MARVNDGLRLAADLNNDSSTPRGDSAPLPGEDERETPTTAAAGTPEQWGTVLRETIPSRFMYASLIRAFSVIDEHAYKAFRDQLIADCGSPTDPIQVMMVEQLALAHLNMGFLQCRAANAPTLKAAEVYGSAAARLMAEFRRSALGLQAYRAASRQLASDPSNDMVVAAGQAEGPAGSEKKACDNELGPIAEEADGDARIIPYRESADDDESGSPPPVPEEPGNRRRTRASAPRRTGKPAVGARHGAANA